MSLNMEPLKPKTNVMKRRRPKTEVIREREFNMQFLDMTFKERMRYCHADCLEPATEKYKKFEPIVEDTQTVLARHGIFINENDFEGRVIRVLELCGGSQCATHALRCAFPGATIEVTRVDRDPTSGADVITDLCFWEGYKSYPEGHFDIVLAWPDCSQLSTMRSNASKDRDVEGTMNLVKAIKNIIAQLKPKFFIIENPHNKSTGLCVQPEMADMERYRQTHNYCMWGFPYPKPTDLWCSHKIPDAGRCCKDTPCENRRRHGKHAMTPQYIKYLWMRHQVPIPLIVAALRTAFHPPV